MAQKSIDIVIPSFRLNAEILLPIFALEKPAGYSIRFFLVADNPALTVPPAIAAQVDAGLVTLIVNPVNLGFSGTRNKGIDAGNGAWILLLDDDIVPQPGLLLAYCRAIEQKPASLGFVGVTLFPEPKNAVTRALELNGSVGHFRSALYKPSLRWSPTANIMLNRALLGSRRFSLQLTKGGEDMEVLLKNSLENKLEYDAVPDAIVTHPWWNNGAMQTRRMFRYGAGAAELLNFPHIRPYSYYDFANTSESLMLIMIMALVCLFLPCCMLWLFQFALFILLAELLTSIIRSVKLASAFSLPLALQMMWHKNVYEAGFLWTVLSSGKISNLGRRIDAGFSRPHPSPFRLNKWKIIKLSLLAAGTAYLITTG